MRALNSALCPGEMAAWQYCASNSGGISSLHRILDNLPVAMVRMREGQGEAIKTYERGFPVGRKDVRNRLFR